MVGLRESGMGERTDDDEGDVAIFKSFNFKP
jgi:hypothetical protein